jgi:hypothetical protein
LRTTCTFDEELVVIVEEAALEDDATEPLDVTDDEVLALFEPL